MDAEPWTYAVSAREVRREGRVAADARPGSKKVPDPRRFATLEACAETRDATLAFSVGLRDGVGGLRWFDSDARLPEFRIAGRASSRTAASAAPSRCRRARWPSAWRVCAGAASRAGRAGASRVWPRAWGGHACCGSTSCSCWGRTTCRRHPSSAGKATCPCPPTGRRRSCSFAPRTRAREPIRRSEGAARDARRSYDRARKRGGRP